MTSTAPEHRPRERRWLAFVQPLLITIGGVAASLVIYLNAVETTKPPCTDAYCGLGINRLINAAFLLCLPLAGMIITGFVAARTTRDRAFVGRAILVGLSTVWVALLVVTEQDVTLSSVVSLVSLILVGLGFVLGRRGPP
jgi:MFS family permease